MRGRKEKKPPDSKEFTAGAVRKAVWSEALQHPTTLLPAAASILSGAYMGLIGLDQTAFSVMLGAGLVSLASVVFHYLIRGDHYAEIHMKKLLARRNEAQNQAASDLEERCLAINFRDGAQQCRELNAAYRKLKDFLANSERPGSSAERFSAMADDCYKQAVGLLEAALRAYRVLREVDSPKLARERDDLEKQARIMELAIEKGNDYHQPRLDALRTRIGSYASRLDRHKERRIALDTLMAEYEVLEGALESTYLQVVDLVGSSPIPGITDPADTLARAVDAARRVETRLRGIEKPGEDDDIYLEAAKGH